MARLPGTSYSRNPKRANRLSKIWRANNKERVRENHRRWVSKNTERCKAAQRRYNKNNHEKRLESCRAWRMKNVKRHRELTRLWRQTNRGKLSTYQLNAENRGLKFSLSLEEFSEILAMACTYCGINSGKTGVDRKDNKKGYTIANSVPCCWQCNRMKMNDEAEDFIRHCKRIAQHCGSDERAA